VIILSTDTEIDEDYFCELDSSISHAYHLEFDDAEMRTTVEEGYFWSRKKTEALA
jgi:DNA sulfur modification protein DndD